ncbi:FUSC family protein [Bradyrhizobium genosp. L]|uniref:FUSC family protein n=1 Tax=Bradyrhizobium genosp. L TaxID=83637 RepID=UPI0018A2D0DA|nr:FUSC family protein [Bradyrhizobium genosp. L]QPF86418.1 FUSC family protein [Bradyrhizobium genosp. L]
MTEVVRDMGEPPPRGLRALAPDRLLGAIWALRFPIRYGVQLWLSVCAALFVAFWLQLDQPYWAGTSAAVSCLPQLGAGLRKGWFRALGTLVGAVVSLVLAAFLAQDRILFLTALAAWGGICAFVTTLLSNHAAYSAGLAGYTVAIIAGGALGSVGGVNANAVFPLALSRGSEIMIGIFCAGVVGVLTDTGDAPRRLAKAIAAVAARVMDGFIDTLARGGTPLPDMRPLRRDLIRQVGALDPVIDQSAGESSQIRSYAALLQRTMDGLFGGLVGWRAVGNHLDHLPAEQARQQAQLVLGLLRPDPSAPVESADPQRWVTDPDALQRRYQRGVRRLVELEADSPSQRLLADKTAEVLVSMMHAMTGLTLVVYPGRPGPVRTKWRLRVADYLPALVNGARAFATIAIMALLWVVTGWPNGVGALTFAMINIILRGPQAEAAYAGTLAFTAGVVVDLALASIITFAVLPALPTSFLTLSLVIGACLVPLGMLAVLAKKPWQIGMVGAMTLLFVPLLSPTNPMSYNTAAFYNSTLSTVVGCFAGAYGFGLMPPLSQAYRARRLLRLTLRDLRRLAGGRTHLDWNGHVLGRLTAMPAAATPLQRAWLLAALSVGAEIIQLREIISRLGLDAELVPALTAIARGDSMAAIAQLGRFDAMLAEAAARGDTTQTNLRVRGSIVVLSEALTQHRDYFDGALQ